MRSSLSNRTGYRFVSGSLANAASQRHMMEGLNLAQGGTARRRLAPEPEPDADYDKALKARRNLDTLTQGALARAGQQRSAPGSTGAAPGRLAARDGRAAAYAIANRYVQSGQWELAREAFLLLADRYPAHPLAVNAYRWLIRHNTSSEARRRHEMGQFLVLTSAELRQGDTTPRQGAWVRGGLAVEGNNAGPEEVRQDRLQLLGSLREVRQWYEGALAIEPRLAGFGPRFADRARHPVLPAVDSAQPGPGRQGAGMVPPLPGGRRRRLARRRRRRALAAEPRRHRRPGRSRSAARPRPGLSWTACSTIPAGRA